MVKLAIAGGNIGGSALISLLRGDPNTELVGIYEKKQDTPGVILARKWNIPVFEDIKSLSTVNPEIIINVTGDPKLSNEMRLAFGSRIEVIEGVGARLLWEIIEKQKRVKIEAHRTVEDQRIIFNLASKLGLAETLEDFLGMLLEKALEIANAPAGSITICENEEMRLVASKGLSRRFTENKAWSVMPGGLTEAIFNNKKVISINDTLKVNYTRNNPALTRENIRALLAFPVLLKDKAVGILYIDDFKPRQFSERQKASLALLASLISISIDRYALIKDMEKLRLKLSTLLEASNDIVLIVDPS